VLDLYAEALLIRKNEVSFNPLAALENPYYFFK